MSRDHGRPSGAALSPVFLGTAPTHAEYARTLVALARHGALSTLAADRGGIPYGSVANFGLDEEGNPLLITSDLAEHTAYFRADPRASLMIAEGGGGDPLALGRVSLLGRVAAASTVELPAVRARYLDRHPSAKYYAEFTDFHFYRLTVEAIRYIGGFGRMSWVDLADYRAARPDPVAPGAAGIIEHMNEDHAEALRYMSRHYARVEGTAARMVAVDRYGFEMAVATEQGPRQVRLPFLAPVDGPDAVRPALIALLRDARAGVQ